jgi:hypothetical protein
VPILSRMCQQVERLSDLQGKDSRPSDHQLVLEEYTWLIASIESFFFRVCEYPVIFLKCLQGLDFTPEQQK